MKVAYKVVSVHVNNGIEHYLSSRIYGTDWILEYKIGEWTFPIVQSSRLFVFDSLEHAQMFAMKSEKIFSCHVISPRPAKFMCSFVIDFPKFWKGRKKGIRGFARDGTLFCKGVRLLQQQPNLSIV